MRNSNTIGPERTKPTIAPQTSTTRLITRFLVRSSGKRLTPSRGTPLTVSTCRAELKAGKYSGTIILKPSSSRWQNAAKRWISEAEQEQSARMIELARHSTAIRGNAAYSPRTANSGGGLEPNRPSEDGTQPMISSNWARSRRIALRSRDTVSFQPTTIAFELTRSLTLG